MGFETRWDKGSIKSFTALENPHLNRDRAAEEKQKGKSEVNENSAINPPRALNQALPKHSQEF